MKKQLVAMDIECYKNYLLVMFKRFSDSKVLYFEKFNDSRLNANGIKNILNKYTIVTFNGIKYDRLIATAGITGFSNQKIHDVSNSIIQYNAQPWEVRSQFCLPEISYDEIDIIELTPLQASLKLYAGRLHAPKMQDLPIEPMATIKDSDLACMRSYCENDLDDTILVYNDLIKAIDLRVSMSRQYGVDLRSKSDSQIAEVVIKHELLAKYNITPKKSQLRPGKKYSYTQPPTLKSDSSELVVLANDFKNNPLITGESGHLQLPEILSSLTIITKDGKSRLLRLELDRLLKAGATEDELAHVIVASHCKDVKSVLRKCKTAAKKNENVVIPKRVNHRIVRVGGTNYKTGMGGLHSMEASITHIPTNGEKLKEYDAISYYPFITIVNKYAPRRLGVPFLKIYERVVKRRVKAKDDGDIETAASLKVTIAGAFGKLSSIWSFLYSPDLLMQITLTGQLSLLMQIEMLEREGFAVVSANTDGIVVSIPAGREKEVAVIVQQWEKITGYTMASTSYAGLYSRDVNSYVAISTDGYVKTKGAYAPSNLAKNPTNEICKTAVVNYLKDNTPVSETVFNCTDITQFVCVRTVKGGAMYENKYVGKAIRWYYSDNELDAMYYKKSGNKVPKSEGAKPLMVLPKNVPDDLDYDWYIVEAIKMIEATGKKYLL